MSLSPSISESITKSNGHELELKVEVGRPALVPPAEETQKGPYYLSNLDENIAVLVRTIYCYRSSEKGNENAGKIIRKAMEKVLVHYYALAGRLKISSDGNLIVDCTGEGAVFVEAEANSTLEELRGITDPLILGKLVYEIPGPKSMDKPPLVAHV
ncbi:unnamed protein product [Fraxinus pennsylvanica]|uniref:Uncharacterized protein n=1 Tax=Fraxinus pennsylvanica TaxID=56036 RepID=A0AAD1ZZB7_9LAMI|nr:unnamed protein product [Fraxinus pennsylvanica]